MKRLLLATCALLSALALGYLVLEFLRADPELRLEDTSDARTTESPEASTQARRSSADLEDGTSSSAGEAEPQPGTIEVTGRIEIEVVGDETEKIRAGFIHIGSLGTEPKEIRRVPFEDGSFQLTMGPNEQALVVEALEVDGLTCRVRVEVAWYTRFQLEEGDMLIQVKIGRRLELEIVDAETDARIEGAEIYDARPQFIYDVRGDARLPKPAARGDSPLSWRAPPSTTYQFHVAARGYKTVEMRAGVKGARLKPAGAMRIVVEGDLEAMATSNRKLALEIQRLDPDTGQPATSRRRRHQETWTHRLDDEEDRESLVKRLPPGTYLVELRFLRQWTLLSRKVVVGLDATPTVRFKGDFARLFETSARARFEIKPPRSLDRPEFRLRDGLALEATANVVGDFEAPTQALSYDVSWDPQREILAVDFGSILPGAYVLRVLNRSIPVYFISEQETAVAITLPEADLKRLTVVDAGGRDFGSERLEVRARPWGKIEAAGSESVFMIPEGTPYVELRMRDNERGIFADFRLDFDGSGNTDGQTFVIPDYYPFEIEFERGTGGGLEGDLGRKSIDQDLETQERLQGLLGHAFMPTVKDAQGSALELHTSSRKDGLMTCWVAAEGQVEVTAPDAFEIDGVRVQSLVIGAGKKPRLRYRIVGQRDPEDYDGGFFWTPPRDER